MISGVNLLYILSVIIDICSKMYLLSEKKLFIFQGMVWVSSDTFKNIDLKKY